MIKMAEKCENCRWVVIGQYNKLYGGRPIGCNCPNNKELYKQRANDYRCGYESKVKGE